MSLLYSKVSSESSRDDSIEEQQTVRRTSGWRRAIGKLQLLRWPVTFFLLVAILFCELSILRHQPSKPQPGTDINGLLPEFSMEKKVFLNDKRYASDHRTTESLNATMREWDDLVPFGGGFLDVPDYTSHNLPPPMHFPNIPDKQVYSLAIFHQLHCLMHLSDFMDKLVLKLRNREFSLDENFLWHNDHCFNYLRHTIMCFGDTTLEGQTQTPGLENVPGTDGTGATHVCRNFEEIRAFADKRKLSEKKEHL